MNELTAVPATEIPPPEKRLTRYVRWTRQHPFHAVLLGLALFAVYEAATIPWFSIPHLAAVNPAETALMRQRRAEAERGGKRLKIIHRWTPLARIPPTLVQAVVVAEDGMFYSHGGVDWYEVQESVSRNIRERRFARGASTITQQLAKNLYLSTSKDPVRKLKEVVITLLLEGFLSKDRILELYLNVIEWGRGVFGVEAAAQVFFRKGAASLTQDECLRLAAVIPSPLRHRPDADSRYVLRRVAMVERRLAARHRGVIITTAEEDEPGTDPTIIPEETAVDSTATAVE